MPLVSVERMSPVLGSNDVDAVHLDADLAAAVVEDLDVGLAEHDEHVAAAGILQLLRHVHVGVDPRLEDRQAAEAAQLGGMRVEVEGAGDQHVEAVVDRLARGGDQVLPADRAIFGADQDGGAALGPVAAGAALDEGAGGGDEVAGPGRDARKAMRSPLACCLTPSALR